MRVSSRSELRTTVLCSLHMRPEFHELNTVVERVVSEDCCCQAVVGRPFIGVNYLGIHASMDRVSMDNSGFLDTAAQKMFSMCVTMKIVPVFTEIGGNLLLGRHLEFVIFLSIE